MEYPRLRTPNRSRQMIDTFRGYDHNLRIAEGAFYDMQNLTSDHYPVFSPREKRGIYAQAPGCSGMIAKDALCYTQGRNIVINGYEIDMGLTEDPKQLISMGAYVIILPDKKYINTEDHTQWGSIENRQESKATVTFTLCRQDGTAYELNHQGAEQPEAPADLDIWLDTSQSQASLKQWSASAGMWVSVTSTYIRIESEGIGSGFSQYDGVIISGLKGEILLDENGKELHSAELEALDGSFVVWQQGEDFLVITGMLSGERRIQNQITVARKMPQMDFVVESGNRLWGCYYGLSEDGTKVINEIYCSKLGDFKNWYCYMGIATDSWAASVGTDGKFTGAITYQGYPLFFKENVLHQVYISDSGAHRIRDTACRGVQEGSWRSLAIVGEVLYYKSNRCICAYGGAMPQDVSQALGAQLYHSAAAGVYGNKYYICMKNGDGVSQVFVLDTDKGLWHREDNTRMEMLCACRGELYFLDGEDGQIKTVSGTGEKETALVEWMAQTGLLGLSEPDMKYISRFLIRMWLPVGSQISGYAQYDSSGRWEHIFTISGIGTGSFMLPVRPMRCDHMQLKLEGTGPCKIYSITKTIEQGSDMP